MRHTTGLPLALHTNAIEDARRSAQQRAARQATSTSPTDVALRSPLGESTIIHI